MTTEIPKTSEEKVRDVLFAGLKQIIPQLGRGDIKIQQLLSDPHDPWTQHRIAQMHKHTGYAGSAGARTRISIDGHELGFTRIRTLKEILDEQTETWSGLTTQSLEFQGSVQGLAELLDQKTFVREVYRRIEPVPHGGLSL